MAEPLTALTLAGVFASVAWFLGLFGGVYCNFLNTTLTRGDQNEGITFNYGIWTYQGYVLASTPDEAVIFETCRSYPDEMYVDAKWKSAMAFSSLAIIIGGIVTLWALFAMCGNPSKFNCQMAGATLLLCCLFQGLSLLFLTSSACTDNPMTAFLQDSMPLYKSEDKCIMSAGAKCTIASIVFWFMAAIPVLKIGIPPVHAVHAVDTGKEADTEEKAIDPDSKLFDKEDAVAEEGIDDEHNDKHTLETTEAA